MRKLILNLTVALLLAAAIMPQVFGQSRTITGTVKDDNGNVLAAATVAVKGTRISATTDADGNFKIPAPPNAKALIISYVGMQKLEFAIPATGVVTAVLKPLPNNLGDVVVVAYGTVKKQDLTGSVEVLKGADLVKGSPTNIATAMQGKIAGVTVTQSDGAPGAGLSIQIRGANSILGGTLPLYVVDGIPYVIANGDATPGSVSTGDHSSSNALSFLNPDDIESITILKDASATAIYGSRGANGVVIITTKKGKAGTDRVELHANLGVAKVMREIKMLDAYGYATMQNEANSNANFFEPGPSPRGIPFPGEFQKSPTNPDSMVYIKGPKDFIGHSNDWQKYIFQTGITNNYTLSVSGADEKGSYLLSGNYIDQSGVIAVSKFNQFSIRANVTRNVKSWLTVGSNTSFNKSTNQLVKTNNEDLSGGVGVVKAALAFSPTAPIYDSGTNMFTAATLISNPYVYVHSVKNQILVSQIFSANYLEAKLAKGLTFRQNVGISYYNNQREQYYPRSVNEGLSTFGLAYQSQGWYNSVTTESLLTYIRNIGEHSLNFVVGQSYQVDQASTKSQQASNFVNDQLQDNNMAGGQNYTQPQSYKSKNSLTSFLGRVTDSWKDRYLFTLSFRNDGTSKFTPKNRWAYFPSGAFAWKLSNEPFMAGVLGLVNDIKIRTSYGRTGNQAVGPYQTLSKLIPYPYVFNGTLSNGYADDQYAGPGNDNLKWETTDQYDAGLDVNLYKNRITFHADVYYKRTHDLLQNVTIPPTTGFITQLVNRGEIENKGLELTVTAVAINNHDFSWDLSGNISFNRNRIVSLGAGLQQQFATRINTNGDQPFIQRVGHPVGALYGYVEQDIYKNEAEVRSDPVMAGQPDAIIARTVGEIRYKDLDHNAAITQQDQTFIGDVNPKFTYGFTNNFTYKNFDMNILIQGVYGNDIINMNTYYLSNIGSFNNVTQKMWDERWTFTNWEHAKSPKTEAQYWRAFKFSRRFIEDGSYIRLRNVSIGYNLKSRLKTLTFIQSLRIYANASNLITITKYTGYDPDINGYGDDASRRGVDMGGYPSSKTFNFGIQATF